MSISFRQIAVSGSAAVALLGGAAAITAATVPTASAAETTTVAHRALTAPVTLPGGRTVRITGMGGYGHRATGEHVATVAAFKTGTGGTQGITNGLTSDGGAGAAIQNPASGQVPAGYNQQVTTQSAGGVIATGVVVILVLGIIVVVRVRGKDVKVGDAVVLTLFGIAISGTVIGSMGHQISGSLIGSLGGVLGGL